MLPALIATFSIVARDPQNGDLGVAVASKFLAVGSVVPWAQANVGAIATQALANIRYGPDGLALLARGLSAQEVLQELLAADEQREHRQVGIVDREGRAAAFTGRECVPWAGHLLGEGFCCQGNILAGEAVVQRMADAFRATAGELAERLVAALEAGQAAGGDRRGRQSAALYVAREGGSYGGLLDRYIDLRVDDHPDPIVELRRLLALHRFYLTRPDEADLIPIDSAIAGELQDALRDLGYYSGPTTNTYDRMTKEALFAYGGVENLEERLVEDQRIDRQVLEFIRRKRAEARQRRG
ncbi:DUF1028 domain-containing protein [Kallotenue papyrolyticum]|uniref:DUF1028 domain-containing protein n=1 Tax=Kallotenue papyrolyticum TaxID=1325125 RepID=UPI0004B7CB74|nr:DUF1028 domain-containing protein [Kallotenue papyrolyticum]